MASFKTGFQYYSVETDRYQDIRIKRLKKECGALGLAVYDYILCEIYRVKGCFLEWDESTAFDVSEYLGLKENQVKEIVNYCCAVGLFSKELLTNERVLTSLAIQSRFTDWSKKAKRTGVKIPEKIKIIQEECDKLPEESEQLPEDFDKVKKSKGKESNDNNPPPTLLPFSVSILKNIDDLKADCLKDRINFVEHVCRQSKKKPESIPGYLDDFNSHLRSLEEHVKSVKEYRLHFQHWLKKQNGDNDTQTVSQVKIKVK